jgi:pantoate--beta-alanine ligase
MLVFSNAYELQAELPTSFSSLGLVPTMGALHQGHISLVERAIKENSHVIVSIYVNPTQFNRVEDLEQYPRNIDKDLETLAPYSNKIMVYIPTNEDLYPEGIKVKTYAFGTLTQYFEGAYRPGHFDGVATVIESLFTRINPTKAYFGEKDFQQVLVIKALVKLLSLNIKIISCPIIRAKDGLALSSRNALLSKEHLEKACVIYNILQKITENRGHWNVQQMRAYFFEKIEALSGFKIDYFAVADPKTLTPEEELIPSKNYRIFIAVYAGTIRLIDTIELRRK